MILCREQIIYVEQLVKASRQIWPDAADTGVLLTSSNRAELRRHVEALRESAEVVDRWRAPNQWTEVYRIAVENDGPNLVSGYIITLGYAKLKGREFAYATIQRGQWSELFTDGAL